MPLSGGQDGFNRKAFQTGRTDRKGGDLGPQTALERQTDPSPASQRNVLDRLARFSVTEEDL
ncbi:hypothetical protein [Methanosphaerula palustris]|uniref:hypothetical protein n=1 Tax=Methanosphaerula palustris TaxID=475088 RepID=UPI000324DD62|nr:hypothetical protein [Methanosphaerula palustris]